LVLIIIQWLFHGGFPALLVAPKAARVPMPFHIHAKENFGKKNFILGLPRFEPRRENFKIKEVEAILSTFLLGELNF